MMRLLHLTQTGVVLIRCVPGWNQPREYQLLLCVHRKFQKFAALKRELPDSIPDGAPRHGIQPSQTIGKGATLSGRGAHSRKEFLREEILRSRTGSEDRNAYDYAEIWGSLNFNPHVHMIGIDGIYNLDEHTALPRFHFQPSPTPAEIQAVTQTVRDRVLKMLRRQNLIKDDTHETNEKQEVN